LGISRFCATQGYRAARLQSIDESMGFSHEHHFFYAGIPADMEHGRTNLVHYAPK
jgi:hypothetical protein